MSLPATDNFNRGDSGSLGANWTEQTHGLQIISTQARGIIDTTYQKAFWNADSFSNDQYSEMTIANMVAGVDVGPTVRASGTDGGANTVFYWMFCHQGGVTKLYYYNGSFNQIGGDITTGWVNGDVARIEVSGTSFTLKRNGSTISSGLTDSNLSSGSAGFILEDNLDACSLWTGGNIGGGGGGDLSAFPGEPQTGSSPIQGGLR